MIARYSWFTIIGSLGLLIGVLSSEATASACVHGSTAFLPTVLLGQRSLLDLGEEEEEESPQPSPQPKGPPLPGGGSEKPPLAQPPLAPRGGSRGSGTGAPQDDSDASDAEPVFDVVQAAWGKRTTTDGRRVKLLPKLIKPPFPPAREYTFTVLAVGGKGYYTDRVMGNQMSGISYYEERVLKRASEVLGIEATQLALPNQVFDVFSDPKRTETAEHAIQLLQTGIAEHNSAVQRLLRQGDQWQPLRDALAQAWFNLQMSRIMHLLEQGQHNPALAACDRLRDYPGLDFRLRNTYEPTIRKCLRQILLEPAAQAIEAERYADARALLEDFLDRYSRDAEANKLRLQLVTIAKQKAKRAVDEKDARLLDEAAEVWPQLVGLDDVRRGIVTTYPVLRCAYTSLPKGFSPLTARTLVDRHAVSLMFESLIRWRRDPRIGPHYATQLAKGRPVPLARGREFQLPRCIWTESANGVPNWCTQEDVFWSVRLLKTVNPPSFPAAWERLVLDIDTSRVNDPFHVSIALNRDHWQPLSLMDFRILPKSSFPEGGTKAEVKDFDKDPLGTGPYRLRSIDEGEVHFVANPYFRVSGLPKIREIVYSRLDSISSHSEFLNGNIHLIYGVRPTQVVELGQQGKRVVTLPTPSVCFIALNHRNPILQNTNLRLALAHAIDRNAILNTCFRPAGKPSDHEPLNGPFPVDSWAHNRKIAAFVPGSASAFLSKARKELSSIPSLRLIYPDRDSEVSLACAEIKKQWEQTLKLEITIDPIEPEVFYQLVEEGHEFDLAYWRHDYRNETYWIWPWFDPDDAGSNGSNFMGYEPDDSLRNLFRKMDLHKQFKTIRSAAQEIHQYIARNAVIIPLWQLDTYVAVSDVVQNAKFDPFDFYEDVEQWELVAQ